MDICKNSGIFYKQILIQNTGRLKTSDGLIFTVATYADGETVLHSKAV